MLVLENEIQSGLIVIIALVDVIAISNEKLDKVKTVVSCPVM